MKGIHQLIKSLCGVCVLISLQAGSILAMPAERGGHPDNQQNQQFESAQSPELPATVSTYPTAIAMGGNHSCALDDQGGVLCWGFNERGQLGDGTYTYRATPVYVSGLTSGVTAIAAGHSHTCALTEAGGVLCWGLNTSGQLGDGTTITRKTPVSVSGLDSGVTSIAAGWDHTCAAIGSGAKCWGGNRSGKLGNDSTSNSSTPVNVLNLDDAVKVGAGWYHSCAITSLGAAKCWGDNFGGKLGDNTNTERHTPVDVVGLGSGVTSIGGGDLHTCALVGNGAKCWGWNEMGQLGDGTNWEKLTPVNVSGLTNGVTGITSGAYYSCALLETGGMKCWGYNRTGSLGSGTTTDSNVPVSVSGLSGATALSAGEWHTCALAGSGIKCWGSNEFGQLGEGIFGHSKLPIDVSGLSSGISGLAGGAFHTCARTTSGAAKCWGWNRYGELGNGSNTDSATPVDVSGLSEGVSAITAGEWHSCAVVNGGVKCWGDNYYGQLGDNSKTPSNVPVDVYELSSGVIMLASGWAHTCALLNTGTVKCWGVNWHGQLGNDSTTSSDEPVDVVDLTSVAGIAANGNHSCALVTSLVEPGALKCWGYNNNGQLGDGTTVRSLIPVDVLDMTTGSTGGTAGVYHSCGTTSTYGAKCWGHNSYGQLGDGTGMERHSPVDVSGLSEDIIAISAGRYHTCALQYGGAMYCWGANFAGQLGDGSSANRNTPVSVLVFTNNVEGITAGWEHSCARTTGGAVKCWGNNLYGRLGNGFLGYRTTPVDVLWPGISSVYLPLVIR